MIVELAAKEDLGLPPGFTVLQDRRYGAAKLVFLRSDGTGDQAAAPSSVSENML